MGLGGTLLLSGFLSLLEESISLVFFELFNEIILIGSLFKQRFLLRRNDLLLKDLVPGLLYMPVNFMYIFFGFYMAFSFTLVLGLAFGGFSILFSFFSSSCCPLSLS